MILSDRDIKRYINSNKLVIDPLSEDTIRENGVDLKIGNEIVRIKENMEKEVGDEFIIYPNEHVLLTTKEYIKLSNDIIAFCNLRSTFARKGLLIPPTIVDAGFEGQLTIELVGSSIPVKLKSGERFLHLIFAHTLTPVEKPYNGKYQNQKGVTLAKED
ncbi:dUTPase [Sulfolobus islandicus rudivirus 1 variant XX]|nr:dUTPase [Sulfolobus islandicus rudivirus 1 variant XX]